MTQPSPIRTGLLGYGLAGRAFHAPFIQAVDGLQLVAVASSRQAEITSALPQVSVYPTPEDVIALPDLDLIIVATPHKLHIPHAVAALQAGKHVVIEKPVALAPADMQPLLAAAQSSGRLAIPYQNRRWDGDFLTVQKLLAEGTLGQLHHVEMHWPKYRPQVRRRWREDPAEGGGLLNDLGPHLIDQALVLFGEPESVRARLHAFRPGARGDDYFLLELGYADGLTVRLECDALNPFPGPRFALRGTAGAFQKFGLDPQEDVLREGAALFDENWGHEDEASWGELVRVDGSRERVPTLPGDYRRFYAGVVQALRGNAGPPVTLDEVAAQVRVMQAAARESAAGGGEIML
jgi:scyllo-inositol 2-dehydrogenase (NADP+)